MNFESKIRLQKFLNKAGVKNVERGTENKIGSGTYGEVWKVLRGRERKPALIKISKSSAENVIKNFNTEYKITKYVANKLNARKNINFFIPRPQGFYQIPGKGALFFLSEIKGVTLHKFLETKPSIDEIEFIRKKLHEYITFLKSIGVVHGDLSQNNIMIEEMPNGKLKVSIIDFGMSRYASNKLTKGFFYHPIPTRVGCNGRNFRTCAIKYGYTNKGSLSGNNNRAFINKILGTNVSLNNRLVNALNLITGNASKNSKFYAATNEKLNRLISLLNTFKTPKYSNRIEKITSNLKKIKLDNQRTHLNNSGITPFISILEGIQRARLINQKKALTAFYKKQHTNNIPENFGPGHTPN
jgi:serine/threonine protein kinase